jgi:hypothetical protein
MDGNVKMRWKTDNGPYRGDRQRRKRFAFFPTPLSDGYTVWLEQYWAEEEWESDSYDGTLSRWRTVRTWCEKKARPNEI